MKINFNHKAISPVVATSLIIVVAVVSTVGFQTWFSTFSSGIFTDVESQTSESSLSAKSGVQQLIDNKLYFFNDKTDNVTLNEIELNSQKCILSENLTPGMNVIDISSCTIPSGSLEVVIATNDKIYSKYVYSTPSNY